METRGTARVSTRLAVAVHGVDDEPSIRPGNISTTGVYFESDREVGAVGSVQWLYLATVDGERTIEMMAYVVRVVEVIDVGSRVRGVALHFMPGNQQQVGELQEFVDHVLQTGGEMARRDHARLRAWADIDTARPVPRAVHAAGLHLETTWPFAPGDAVELEIVTPDAVHTLRLTGRAVDIVRAEERRDGKPRWRVEVSVEHRAGSRAGATSRPPPSARTAGTARLMDSDPPLPPPSLNSSVLLERELDPEHDAEMVSSTLEHLLAAILGPDHVERRGHRKHLSGQLDRIRLPTVLSLFEMEALSGKLVVTHGDETVKLYVLDGNIVDVEPLGLAPSHRDAVARLLMWSEGSFEFVLERVDRPDRLRMGTTALLLDLAREADEAGKMP